MSFYITLPSNTPSHVTNTQSNFTTFLNDTILLKGNYEVALSEINFSSNYSINFGKITVKHFDFAELIIIDVIIPNGLLLADFVMFLNRSVCKEIEYFKKLKDPDFETLTKEQFTQRFTFKIIDYFSVQNNIIFIESSLIKIKLVEGLIKRVFSHINEGILLHDTSEVLPDRLNVINYIIVYTNIIDFQYFGDKKTQILRALPVTYHNGEFQSVFNNNHYVKVKDTNINSINIQLRDIWGDPIRFDDFFSFVIVNLHFQPTQ